MVLVTTAEPEHLDAIITLTEEMDRFYGATDTDIEPVNQRAAQITDALFGSPAAAHALLAWDNEQAVGLAAYSFLWPAEGMTRSLYLKELYVSRSHRRRGVGSLLMKHLFNIAGEHRCSRVEWTTDQDNINALHFYHALGATRYPTKIFFRVGAGDFSDSATGHHISPLRQQGDR